MDGNATTAPTADEELDHLAIGDSTTCPRGHGWRSCPCYDPPADALDAEREGPREPLDVALARIARGGR